MAESRSEVALADPFQILLVLSILPIIILAVLLWLIYNHGKRVGRLETRASKTSQHEKMTFHADADT